MKTRLMTFRKTFLMLLLSFVQLAVFAQTGDSGSGSGSSTVTKETTTTTTVWYTQPWVWVIGGAVFLIILIALLRGGSTTDKEVRTTVIRERP